MFKGMILRYLILIIIVFIICIFKIIYWYFIVRWLVIGINVCYVYKGYFVLIEILFGFFFKVI